MLRATTRTSACRASKRPSTRGSNTRFVCAAARSTRDATHERRHRRLISVCILPTSQAMRAANRAKTVRLFTSERRDEINRLPEVDEIRDVRNMRVSSFLVTKLMRGVVQTQLRGLLLRGWSPFSSSGAYGVIPGIGQLPRIDPLCIPRIGQLCLRIPPLKPLLQSYLMDDTSPYLTITVGGRDRDRERKISPEAARLIVDTAIEAIEVLQAIFRLERTAACKVRPRHDETDAPVIRAMARDTSCDTS